MKQSLQIKMGQSLAMTPQLQQAIKLLQLSTLELQTEIQSALESNPMLELQEDEGGGQESAEKNARDNKEKKDEAASDAGEDVQTGNDSSEIELSSEAPDNIPEELPVDSAWDDIYEPSYTQPSSGAGPSDDSGRDFTEFHNSGNYSLQDHLDEQIRLVHLSDKDQYIAASLIDAIDNNGYLSESLEELTDGMNASFDDEELNFELDEVEAVLRMIQQLDPAGCGARDIGECMAVQLSQLPPSDVVSHAKAIVSEHLNLLAGNDFAKIRRQLKINEEQLSQAIALIRSLNPRPGRQIVNDHNEYIVPDVFVKKVKGVWRVELNPDIAPKLGINSLYAGMVKRADKSDDNNFLRNHLQEARWFIKSLQSRNETLLRVGTAIVERQRGFLEFGEEAMKPLVLRDIAEQLDLHESTISRVTTQKYIHTPRGIFEFKYFFSSHVSTVNGGECSATAIRAMIKRYIAAENPAKPLSDSKIASTLVDEGIQVARRTVAKYRESMAIPPSNERKRLG
ncbi:RNA polymerase factor sigma-54 [Granulosicoccaceae sp. 1_MG-2023]|nr:RNA polymerase factor sigma-54 [Granulosicoccaceae sp. 1_MG-2023]